MSRKVLIIEHEEIPRPDNTWGPVEYEKVAAGTGIFIQYGIDFEELENGVGTYSTGIVEMKDGTIKNVPVENLQFFGDED